MKVCVILTFDLIGYFNACRFHFFLPAAFCRLDFKKNLPNNDFSRSEHGIVMKVVVPSCWNYGQTCEILSLGRGF